MREWCTYDHTRREGGSGEGHGVQRDRGQRARARAYECRRRRRHTRSGEAQAPMNGARVWARRSISCIAAGYVMDGITGVHGSYGKPATPRRATVLLAVASSLRGDIADMSIGGMQSRTTSSSLASQFACSQASPRLCFRGQCYGRLYNGGYKGGRVEGSGG